MCNFNGNFVTWTRLSSLTFLIILKLTWAKGDFESAIHVQTTSGRVKGYRVDLSSANFDAILNTNTNSNTNATEREVIRFYGIRYAEAKVRFTKSEALLQQLSDDHQNTDINNDEAPPSCPQMPHIVEFSDASLPPAGIHTDENCLKLNVFSPASVTRMKKQGQPRLPILIWIPGDGFNFADIVQYDGSALALKGQIIVITVNYRVGVFGFMSSGNETLPGNAGLYDILNAIKWVRKNADAFYGDAEKITVAGRFSGSMALSALSVSPLFIQKRDENATYPEKPLAKRMILHSGIASGRYVLDYEPMAALLQLADLTHCKKSTLDDSINCLRNVSTKILLQESMKIAQLWKPVIDHQLILDDPLKLFQEGKFPHQMDLLIGDNTGAGSICVLSHEFQDKTGLLQQIKNDQLNEADLKKLIRHSLQEFFDTPEDEMTGLAAVATHEYSSSRPPCQEDKEYKEALKENTGMIGPSSTYRSFRNDYLRFCGIMYIRHAVEIAARSVSERSKSNVFRYEWSYSPSQSHFTEKWHPKGSIGEEVIFLFPHPNPINRTKFSKADEEMRDRFMSSWIAFVQDGDPSTPSNIKWQHFRKHWKAMQFINHVMKPGSTESLNQDVHFWAEGMYPLFQSLRDIRKKGEIQHLKKCPNLNCPAPSILSHSLQAIVILVGIALGLLVLYFFVKNWGQPRSLWKF